MVNRKLLSMIRAVVPGSFESQLQYPTGLAEVVAVDGKGLGVRDYRENDGGCFCGCFAVDRTTGAAIMPASQPMITDPDDFESEKPVCGMLSIAAPFVGFVLGMTWAGSLRGDSTGAGGAICLLKIMPLAFIAGAVLAILAFRRGERWRALPIIGLVLNTPPLLFGLIVLVLTLIRRG